MATHGTQPCAARPANTTATFDPGTRDRCHGPVKYRDLDPADAQAELQRDPTLHVLDVRTPQEFASHRLPNAVLVPVQELQQRLGELDKDANWLVHCEHGRRSLFACEILAQAGFGKLANLRGGLAYWAGCGLPLETGKRR